jgi:hypothetical protein
MSILTSPLIEVEDSWEAVNDWFLKNKLSDGLPIVPPTPERVERMLAGTHRDPQEVIGPIPPKLPSMPSWPAARRSTSP